MTMVGAGGLVRPHEIEIWECGCRLTPILLPNLDRDPVEDKSGRERWPALIHESFKPCAYHGEAIQREGERRATENGTLDTPFGIADAVAAVQERFIERERIKP